MGKLTLDEIAELVNEAAEVADEAVRPAERPSTVWLKCFQAKFLTAVEENDE